MSRGRRIKSPHPGVKLRSRTWASGEVTWFARCLDPERTTHAHKPVFVDVNLTKLGRTSHEARIAWARARSRTIQARLVQIADGDAARTQTPVAEAVKAYLDDHVRARLHGETIPSYEADAVKFVAWAEAVGLRHVEDLTAQRLVAYRDRLASRAPRRCGKGRVWADGEGRVRPETLNTRMRHLRAMLNWLRRRGKVPLLSRDAISDALQRETVPRDPPLPFRAGELQQLLRAALRHDGERLKESREERRAGVHAPKGETPKHKPIAPILLFVLLSGARIGEVAKLEWANVDLTATNERGEVVGSVRIVADTTKTGTGRVFSLGHSPALRLLLAALKVRSGGDGLVFPGWTDRVQTHARQRLISKFGAPGFTWSAKSATKAGALRSTTECYLTNAPSIFGTGSVWAAAAMLGHNVVTAQRHYLGVLPGLDPAARTLEAAMKIEDLAREVVARVSGEREKSGARARQEAVP